MDSMDSNEIRTGNGDKNEIGIKEQNTAESNIAENNIVNNNTAENTVKIKIDTDAAADAAYNNYNYYTTADESNISKVSLIKDFNIIIKAVNAAKQGITIADISLPDQPLIFVNPAFLCLTGYPLNEIIGRNCRFLQGKDTDHDAVDKIRKAIKAGNEITVTLLNYKKDGTPFWNELRLSPVKDENGEVTHYIGLQLDVSKELEMRRQLEVAAVSDALTELPNRKALEEHLTQAVERANRSGLALGVGFIDIDDFKLINDTYGHQAGDNFLKTIAKRITLSIRKVDYAARIGGDEFIVIFENINKDNIDELKPLLDRLHDAISEPIVLSDGIIVKEEASMGLVVCFDGNCNDTAEIMRKADYALYAAKSAKANRKTWWVLADEAIPAVDIAKEYIDTPYGEEVARLLIPAKNKLLDIKDEFIELFYDSLAISDGPKEVLSELTNEEFDRLKLEQGNHFEKMIDPYLNMEEHKKIADAAGIIHVGSGIEIDWLIKSYDLYLNILQHNLMGSIRMRPALSIISRRLTLDARWQIEVYKELEKERNAAFKKIDDLVWKAINYGELIEGAVNILSGLKEICGVVIGRTDVQGIFRAEAINGIPIETYFTELDNGIGRPVMRDSGRPEGQGKIGEAYRTGEIQIVVNYIKDKSVLLWKDLYKSLNAKSAAMVPLKLDEEVFAVLVIFVPFVGGFGSPAHKEFLNYLHHIISLGLEKLKTSVDLPEMQSVSQRGIHRKLLHGGGLAMYYQPVINLKTGEFVKVEALARLKNGDTVLSPGQFLPSFKAECLYELYKKGLELMFEDYRLMLKENINVDVSINLPSYGLIDKRYAEITKKIIDGAKIFDTGSYTEDSFIQDIDIKSNKKINNKSTVASGNIRDKKRSGKLWIELLESDVLELNDIEKKFKPWIDMGVHFAEDDLGSGYSSLLRLRQLPFELVKIDQGLVRGAHHDPLTVIELIAHLTDLAQALDRVVVVEGLECRGLIEAATILGADFGQGYAIAKPMPVEDLVAWAHNAAKDGADYYIYSNLSVLPLSSSSSNADLGVNSDIKITFLGALANLLRFERRLKVVGISSLDNRAIISSEQCGLEDCIDKSNLKGTDLDEAHKILHNTAVKYDIHSAEYRSARENFIKLLRKYLPIDLNV
ncbi:MAG: diguanylate cyclase [Candidatus Acididesulfobacter guangdongensis]|uniref:Diguanylate cyclase DosC n=1 Tax=Acididesulfobacter guangdongensis TaxID=2597225 RepID=A0A519BGY5_ACIG2|nr:MAG: diguanylate cyclase [Candidatus Acididesulfobacter guangdongensis]